MLFVNGKYLTVFEVAIFKKYKKVICNLSSTNRYIKDNKVEYENMYWKCEFIGNAYEKAVNLNDKDKIDLKKALIMHRDSKYIVKVFDFEMSDLTKPNIDKQMQEIDATDDEELIFTV
ncbi:hypothetical protein FL857_10775 [Criibacterium bergeronii]|uniref:Uncharacterized protein n=1 Tax=Criibacterium bergeronii TaxID=1871336 RepID=A0A552UXE7_9FIRM|nr:hypothetical protein [Criibacterium bergeronii]TRW22885.1 hypothetical protein FL857_10775 [Criibacterium bergeronii]